MTAVPASGDTIVALATASGRAGVAVTRLSGPAARTALLTLCGHLPEPRTAHRTSFRHPDSGDIIDDGLVLWFPGPASFTGEDCAEFHGHGGRAVREALISALCTLDGVRLAEPGEFSRRAYINGKMDLTTVEGVADLIAADTDRQRRQALRHMRGDLATRLETWRQEVIRHMAWIEASIDFSEDDLPEGMIPHIRTRMGALTAEIATFLNDNRRGERLRNGVHVAIIGRPNVGKSSLVNALARRDVAIVSGEAGTTRDVIEVHLDLGGFPVIVSDTAGLRNTAEQIEAEGIRRARAAAANADVVIALGDASVDTSADTPFDEEITALMDARTVVVMNKCDQVNADRIAEITAAGQIPLSLIQGCGVIEEEGLPELLKQLLQRISQDFGQNSESGDPLTLTRSRHRTALTQCHTHLQRAGEATDLDLMAEDMRLAARALGQITGRVRVDDFLDVIFSEFCIGK